MSKNDDVVRVWDGGDSGDVGHWCWATTGDMWHYWRSMPIQAGDIFCLNDRYHEPPRGPRLKRTNSLEGLL